MAIDKTRNVFVVDPDKSTRTWITNLLKSINIKPKFFNNGDDLLKALKPKTSGCVICEVRLAGMSGPKLIEELHAQRYPVVCLVLTSHGDVPTTVEAMKAGAENVFDKKPAAQPFLDAVNDAVDKSKTEVSKVGRRIEAVKMLERLTDREKEVLMYLVNGYHNRGIAKLLKIRERTIEAHRAGIMRKLEARSIVDVIRMAFLSGMGDEVPPPPPRLVEKPRRAMKKYTKKKKRRGRPALR